MKIRDKKLLTEQAKRFGIIERNDTIAEEEEILFRKFHYFKYEEKDIYFKCGVIVVILDEYDNPVETYSEDNIETHPLLRHYLETRYGKISTINIIPQEEKNSFYFTIQNPNRQQLTFATKQNIFEKSMTEIVKVIGKNSQIKNNCILQGYITNTGQLILLEPLNALQYYSPEKKVDETLPFKDENIITKLLTTWIGQHEIEWKKEIFYDDFFNDFFDHDTTIAIAFNDGKTDRYWVDHTTTSPEFTAGIIQLFQNCDPKTVQRPRKKSVKRKKKK